MYVGSTLNLMISSSAGLKRCLHTKNYCSSLVFCYFFGKVTNTGVNTELSTLKISSVIFCKCKMNFWSLCCCFNSSYFFQFYHPEPKENLALQSALAACKLLFHGTKFDWHKKVSELQNWKWMCSIFWTLTYDIKTYHNGSSYYIERFEWSAIFWTTPPRDWLAICSS